MASIRCVRNIEFNIELILSINVVTQKIFINSRLLNWVIVNVDIKQLIINCPYDVLSYHIISIINKDNLKKFNIMNQINNICVEKN